MSLILQQVDRVDVAPQSGLVLKLRQTFRALIRKVVGVDLDVLRPVGLLKEALGAHPAAILCERVAGPIANVTRKGRSMVKLCQTVRALMLPVVVGPGMFRQAFRRFERFRTVATLVLSAVAGGDQDGRRNQPRSFGEEFSRSSLPVHVDHQLTLVNVLVCGKPLVL